MRLSSIALVSVLILAFLLRVANLDYNSPFLDEAMYIVLGKKVLEGKIHEVIDSTSWVGGFPLFYPTISGIAYEVGGIEASRLVNVVLGTVAVYLIYLFAKNLNLVSPKFNDQLGIVAAALLAVLPVPVAFSRLAIYDVLSFSLFLGGIHILQKAIKKKISSLFFVSALLFFLSFLTKYIVILFLPFFLFPLYSLLRKTRQNLELVITAFLAPLLFLLGFYFLLNFQPFTEYFLGQVITKRDEFVSIISIFFNFTWLPYLLSLAGIALTFRRKITLVFSLLLVSLAPLIAHLVAGRANAIDQHTFLSLVFILPVAATTFVWILKRNKLQGSILAIAFTIALIYASTPQVKNFGSFWPNSTRAVEFLESNVRKEDKIFAEADDVFVLALSERIPLENVVGPFFFEYKEKESEEAYVLAFSEGFFDFVQFDGLIIDENVRKTYEGSLSQNYIQAFDDGAFKIYKIQRR